MDRVKRNSQRISVHIEGQKLSMTVPADRESFFRYAEEELRLTTDIYKARYPNSSEIPSNGYTAMAAIDIAYRKKLADEALSVRDLADRLANLSDKAELAIARGTLLLSPKHSAEAR